jgi:hypothetical protein
MPVSNPSAGAAATAQPPDIQQLVALLGSLMPLLLRFQSQTLAQPFPSGPGHIGLGNFGFGNFGIGSIGPDPIGFGNIAGLGNIPMANPALDHQAAVNLVADITADSLRNLSTYLEANVGPHPALQPCVPIVTQAARSFAAQGYAQAFDLVWQAYRLIATIRAADPQIPPLRAGGQTISSDSTAIH